MSRSRHPSAGDLVRRLDGELDAARSSRLARHLIRCSDCRRRLAALEGSSREARRYLGSLPSGSAVSEVRRARARAALRGAEDRHRAAVRVRRVWAVAAAMAGIMIVSLSAGPVRAWVARLVPSSPSSPVGVSAPDLTLPAVVVGSSGSVVSFHPAADDFELSVESAQGRGELFLQVLPLDRATAQITGAADESLMILPAGLRIENSGASDASYRVTLPPTVNAVLVSIGDGEPRRIEVPAGSQGWSVTIPLRR